MRQPREETMLDFVSPSSGPNLSPKTSEEEARERAPLSVNGCANGFPGARVRRGGEGERAIHGQMDHGRAAIQSTYPDVYKSSLRSGVPRGSCSSPVSRNLLPFTG